jgi:lysophospholipase L1-like esterase
MKMPALLLLVALLTGGADDKLTVHMVGDSTMADKPKPETNPERGWGQILPQFLDDKVVVRNYAVNGRSSKSFIDEGKWAAVLAQTKKGDYVLIQFGHNDFKPGDPKRHTNPYTGYRRNMERYVADTRAKGATPVILTSIVQRKFNEKGVLEDTHGAYTFVARQVAKETSTPFVDLQLMTEDLVIAAGPDSSKNIYLHVAPGNAMYPEGKQDDTHLSVRGATEVARLAARGLKALGGPLAKHVKGVE